MSIVCEEIFDEHSHPTIEEIKDYALKIGIDPHEEPQLLPIAAEGLMKALPAYWKPCYDEKSKSYYYYNRQNGQTQWEHPLDNVYRSMVRKAKADSQSISFGEPTDDATYARDELPSFEEPPSLINPNVLLPKKLEPLLPIQRSGEKQASPRRLKRSPSTVEVEVSPKHDKSKFFKQKSEDQILSNRKPFTIGNKNEEAVNKVSKTSSDANAKQELRISGGGCMFLKTNTKKVEEADDKEEVRAAAKPKSILGNHFSLDVMKDLDLDDRSDTLTHDYKATQEKEDKVVDDDKKSVRFNFDKSESTRDTTDEDESKEVNKSNAPLKVFFATSQTNSSKSPFALAMQSVPPLPRTLKVIKPNPSDFLKPSLLKPNKGSDSEDEEMPLRKLKMDEIDLDSDNSYDSPDEMERKIDKRVVKLKEKIWKDKNDELLHFQENLEQSQMEELKRITDREKEAYGGKLAEELKKIRDECEEKNKKLLEEEKIKMDDRLQLLKTHFEENLRKEQEDLKEKFEMKREELEKYYEEKLVEIENNLALNMEKNRDDLIVTHAAILDQLKQNNAKVVEKLKNDLELEEEKLRRNNQTKVKELKDDDKTVSSNHDRDEKYEKLKLEKRLLEDKYKCLKEKYLRLKNDVRLTFERRTKKKEEARSGATTTTGSETERTFSGNKDMAVANKPPTPKNSKNSKNEKRGPKDNTLNDIDTSISDRSEGKPNYDTSDNSTSQGRNYRKVFSKSRGSKSARGRNTKEPKNVERSCSPVENLRRQLQKLEDLEDQFPQNQQSDATYHLRYPFSDGCHKFEGSSELEFFRHRIHLERDSIKRAKESLRSQRALFQQRQKELKLKHGSMARHTYQQLCQEEKELTDMEVSLHRTRGLLGEKVIRLRHLEQTLRRASSDNKPDDATTLSDLSSHSASSGISSTEFASADMNIARSLLKTTGADSFQEPSEIIQSLESLNLEIKEIWEVLRTQQQQSGNLTAVIPPFIFPDLGWPVLGGTTASFPAPPSIPTLADRLNNYRQHVALANAQSTVVTHAANNQGATTTLVERTRNLKHWLKQAGIENNGESCNPKTNLKLKWCSNTIQNISKILGI